MSKLDEGMMDPMERQRRLAVAFSSKTPPSVADRLAALELKSAQDLELIHRAIKRIAALEDMGVPLGTPRVTLPSLAEGIFVRLNESPIETVVGVPEARLAELERIESEMKSGADKIAFHLVSKHDGETIFDAAARELSVRMKDWLASEETVKEQRTRIAALEMIERDFAAMREDCDAFQAKVAALNTEVDRLGRVVSYHKECFVEVIKERDEADAKVAALESESHTCPPGFRMVAVEEWERVKREAVDATELARETLKAWEPHLRGETVIAKACERLAARAPAKREPAPTAKTSGTPTKCPICGERVSGGTHDAVYRSPGSSSDGILTVTFWCGAEWNKRTGETIPGECCREREASR